MGVKQQEDLSEKHYFYTRDYTSMFIYRATTPKNPDFPHTAGAKPHQKPYSRPQPQNTDPQTAI